MRAWLVEALHRHLPQDAVLADPQQMRPFECDGLSAYRQLPAVVVLPQTREQVGEVLRICRQAQVPVVTRGAGTGLSGGALPLANGVLLVMSRMQQILNIDRHNLTATVQPGVTNLAISQAARQYGLYYAPDPSSQIACSIGGNVAENAGGVHCLKYGLTVNNLVRLQALSIDGHTLELGTQALDGPGLDLQALCTGSEGMLAVITEITVRLLPCPPKRAVLLAAFDSLQVAGDAVAALISAGVIPAGLEMMDHAAINAAEDFVHAGYPRDAQAILICELDGTAGEVQYDSARVRALLSAAGATDVRTARDERQAQQFWSGRKNAFPAVGRIANDYYCMDGTIPRHALGQVLTRIGELSVRYGLAVANVFHAGDGNLHPLILFDADAPGELAQAEAFGGEILQLCVSAGGSITGEHGVGHEKINQMCAQFSDEELTQFHQIKAAFDPHGLLNPGKAVPTLARCAEFGAMHVRKGRLAFPDLERF